jgi:sigma-E factor negative regulatory protein RseA
MNEMLDSQLSAMFDDELPAAECELLARRLARDESLQARWRSYAVIGAAMRGERGLALQVNLAARVHGMIASEPALTGTKLASPAERSAVGRRLWQGAAAAAVAASVAAVSVFWLRANSQLDGSTIVAQSAPTRPVSTGVVEAADTDTPESYVVPPTSPELRPAMPTAELANYVVAHSEFSSPLIRRNLLSSLVASEPGTAAAFGESEEAPGPATYSESNTPNENARISPTHAQTAQ